MSTLDGTSASYHNFACNLSSSRSCSMTPKWVSEKTDQIALFTQGAKCGGSKAISQTYRLTLSCRTECDPSLVSGSGNQCALRCRAADQNRIRLPIMPKIVRSPSAIRLSSAVDRRHTGSRRPLHWPENCWAMLRNGTDWNDKLAVVEPGTVP